MTISSGFSSCRDAVSAAGKNALWWQFSAWYPKLEIAVEAATGELMADRIDPGEWVKRCQKAADDTAKDSTVTKYTR
jgi:N-acetylglucosamine transport system substrate-binding protein